MRTFDKHGGKNERNRISEQLVDLWFGQVLDGLMYLWSQNIVHRCVDDVQLRIVRIVFHSSRNLKPESVYLRDATNQQHDTLVIGDMLPASVAYDLRMRTRLPRRT